MATCYISTTSPIICYYIFPTYHLNINFSCEVLNQRSRGQPIHDQLSRYNVLAGMASIPCCRNPSFLFSLCLHFLSCCFSSLLAQNDYQETSSQAKLHRLSGLHHE